jgi:hypothetical protein
MRKGCDRADRDISAPLRVTLDVRFRFSTRPLEIQRRADAGNQPNPEPQHSCRDASEFPKMGKCYEIKHFLNFRGIWLNNPQPNSLITFEINKSVSPVSPVSTVLFRGAYNGRYGSRQPLTGTGSQSIWRILPPSAPMYRNSPALHHQWQGCTVFFPEQSYRSRWKEKVGVRQMEEQSYRSATVARRRQGGKAARGGRRRGRGSLLWLVGAEQPPWDRQAALFSTRSPEGWSRERRRLKRKPESVRKQEDNRNVIAPSRFHRLEECGRWQRFRCCPSLLEAAKNSADADPACGICEAGKTC